MKRVLQLCIMLLVVMGLSACHFIINTGSKTEEAKTEETKKEEKIDKAEKDTKEKESSKKGKIFQPNKEKKADAKTEKKDDTKSSKKKKTKILSDQEARKKLYDDHLAYVNRLAEDVPEYEAIVITDVEELLEISESDFYQKLYMLYAYGYGQMRERYPGIYKIYLLFASDLERESFEKGPKEDEYIHMNILYVNTVTGQTFIDSGEAGIYALSDLEPVAFQGNGMNEDMHVDLILWAMKNQGIIPNIYDFGSWMEFEDESAVEEFEDPFPDLGGEPDGVIFRYPIYDLINKKVIGYYDFDLASRKIWNSHTEEVIYEDPLAEIKEKKITENNAVEETVKILNDLYYLENPEEYSFSAEADNLGDIFEREGFTVMIRSKGKDTETEPVIARYFITEDGRRVYLYDEASDTYYSIYGTALWYEN